MPERSFLLEGGWGTLSQPGRCGCPEAGGVNWGAAWGGGLPCVPDGRLLSHQNGNITELLLKEGFARCVDWSMAVYTRGAEKLRSAER